VRFVPTPQFHLRSWLIFIAAVTLLILAFWWIGSKITDTGEPVAVEHPIQSSTPTVEMFAKDGILHRVTLKIASL
jgi:hypothetical protein